MQELKTVSLRPKTQTVSVYTRHFADCSKKGEPQWRRCKCAKYLYLLRDGNNKTISAKTRSWDKAEQQAQEIRQSWDPVKQKLRELDELKEARELGEVTITFARCVHSHDVEDDVGFLLVGHLADTNYEWSAPLAGPGGMFFGDIAVSIAPSAWVIAL
jgi:hypothetical protein